MILAAVEDGLEEGENGGREVSQETVDLHSVKRREHQRIDAFELRCWRTLLRVPWTASRSNQSILKEINLGFLLKE